MTATEETVGQPPATVAAVDTGPYTKRWRHGWLIEVGAGALIFLVYDWLRDQAAGTSVAAYRHATQIVDIEKFLGIYREHAIHHWFLSADWFIAFWNIYYGTIHFVLPVVALVWMYRRTPVRYVRWRNTMVFMLGISLIGFWVYPLMPPRLMPARFDFVDTAARFFNFGPQVHVELDRDGQPTAEAVRAFGNLYAAMPSLHVGWSTWVVLSLWPLVRRKWARVLLVAYPVTVIFGIVVTANHWILDAVGGWVVLALAYLGALGVERVRVAVRDG